MKKSLLAIVSALMLAFALPTMAMAAPSPSGNTATSNGVTMSVTADNGARIIVEATDQAAANFPGDAGFDKVAKFEVYPEDRTSWDLSAVADINAQGYAGATADIYIEHHDGSQEHFTKTLDGKGDTSVTLNKLSYVTVALKKGDASAATTNKDTSSTSPQTGFVELAAPITAAAAVAASGVAVTLRKKNN